MGGDLITEIPCALDRPRSTALTPSLVIRSWPAWPQPQSHTLLIPMSLSDLCLFVFANGSFVTLTLNGHIIMQPDCTSATRTHRSGFLVSARVYSLNTSHHWYLSENHVPADSRSRRCMCSEKDRPAILKWIEMASQKPGIRLFVTSQPWPNMISHFKKTPCSREILIDMSQTMVKSDIRWFSEKVKDNDTWNDEDWIDGKPKIVKDLVDAVAGMC